jgi:hypothetical protein
VQPICLPPRPNSNREEEEEGDTPVVRTKAAKKMYPAMETVELVFGPESESDAKMSDVKSNVPPKPTAEAAPPKAKTAAKKPVAPAPPTQSNVPPKPTAEAAPPKATTPAKKPVAPAPPTQVGAEKKTTKRRFLVECPKFGPVDEGKLPLQYLPERTREIGYMDLLHHWFQHVVTYKRTSSLEQAFRVSRQFKEKTGNANFKIRKLPEREEVRLGLSPGSEGEPVESGRGNK